MKMKLVICTTDENYASRFINYFNIHYAERTELCQFTELDMMEQFIKSDVQDICLVDAAMVEKISEEVKQISSIIVLANRRDEEIEGIDCVFKYQKAELIYKELLNHYADHKKGKNVQGGLSASVPIYAFCSASGGTGASTVALAYAIHMAKEKNVLYLNLQQYGNSDLVLRGEGTGTFDDVLFALNNKRSDLSLKLESLVRKSKEGVSFFTTCENPMDLQELTVEEINRLLQELVDCGLYQMIIIDIDGVLGELEIAVLSAANHIVVVEAGNETNAIKFEKFCKVIDTLKSRESKDLLSKMGIFYNKFSNKNGNGITERDVPVLGGMAKIEGAQLESVVARMAIMDCFSEMEKMVLEVH